MNNKNSGKTTIHIAGLIENDACNCDDGFSVTVFFSGCSHHCPGCHNPEAWDYNYGKLVDVDKLADKVNAIADSNGIRRSISVLGGEPLDPRNIYAVYKFLQKIKEKDPERFIYCWTGYLLEDLYLRDDQVTTEVLRMIDCLIDGPFMKDYYQIDLKLRGSTNQRILYKGKDY